MMKRNSLLFLLLLLLVAPVRAQQLELQMSQYMFNGLALNPALAGAHEAFNAQLLYRQQWWGLDGAPSSQLLSVDGSITQSNSMGWGVTVANDMIGLMRNTGAYATYAYRTSLNKLGDRLCLGLSVGAMQQAFDGVGSNIFDNRGNPIYDAGDDALMGQSRFRPDFRVGAHYSMGKLFYAGLSMSNIGSFLTSSSDSLSAENYVASPYAYLNAGLNVYLHDKWKLSPSLLVSYPLHDVPSFDVNVAATFADICWLGVGYRMAVPGLKLANEGEGRGMLNAIAVMAEVWVTESIRIGYSYDYALSGLSGAQYGSHEISLGFTLARKIIARREATK
jgi:type IX secretion system PorP/SprF family membrane protein